MQKNDERNQYAIEIENLAKSYGKKRGVREISFRVEQGDIFGFLGPNGAGKSTTIRSMLGMLRFSEGRIRILGMDAQKQQKEILSKVGYMPSEAFLYPSMRVKEVIRFSAQARKRNCEKEAEKLCRILEMDVERKIGELSLGNRKKVSIVCAMQHRPELLILDEPTSGLDPLMQEAFFRLLLEYNHQGTTIFLSSHVLSEVKKYCRHAAIIRDGSLVGTDSVANLSKTDLRRVTVREKNREQVFIHQGDIKELLTKLNQMELEDVLIEEPPLEEIFMHYYE